ncbi:MAG: winged helix-turn-helix domain-containing protein, partial [Thiohalomonadales bacterium]
QNSQQQDNQQGKRNHIMRFDIWHINLARRELKNNRDVITTLTSGEYDLLLAFAENAQAILTRDQLLDITRGRSAGPFDRSIDVQLSRLRKKIEIDPKNPQIIKTVRNGGYVFTPIIEFQL